MDLKNNLISICSSFNIFWNTSYKIRINYFMSNKIKNKWEPTQFQIDEIILPTYTDFSKSCVSYIKQPECQHYIGDKLRDLADAIVTSYPSVQDKNSNF